MTSERIAELRELLSSTPAGEEPVEYERGLREALDAMEQARKEAEDAGRLAGIRAECAASYRREMERAREALEGLLLLAGEPMSPAPDLQTLFEKETGLKRTTTDDREGRAYLDEYARQWTAWVERKRRDCVDAARAALRETGGEG